MRALSFSAVLLMGCQLSLLIIPEACSFTFLMQTGAYSSGIPGDYRTNDTLREMLFPFWAAGITGKDQVGVNESLG